MTVPVGKYPRQILAASVSVGAVVQSVMLDAPGVVTIVGLAEPTETCSPLLVSPAELLLVSPE